MIDLAYGIARPAGGGSPRVCARDGERVVDLAALAHAGVLEAPARFEAPSLNAIIDEGPDGWRELHASVRAALGGDAEVVAGAALDRPEMLLPVEIGDYVDFNSSPHHAFNCGHIFRPGTADPILPNWRHLPVGYHGRSASVVVSGTPVVRPTGQRAPGPDGRPEFGPSIRLDVEVEVGFVLGPSTRLGAPVPATDAERHVFGVVLVNDWSARDIQSWETQPLGPFLGKSFATTMSAWVVPFEALGRRPGPEQDPPVLPYLSVAEPRGIELQLELAIASAAMREQGVAPVVVSHPRYDDMYWSPGQQVAHLTVNGAAIRAGDLIASGTVSGPTVEERGCLLELTWNGENSFDLPDGTTRTYLEDGDEVVMRAWSDTSTGRVELGAVRGVVQPARSVA